MMFWNTILLLLNQAPHGIPVLQNDWIWWGWSAWFNLGPGLPRRLSVLQLTPALCDSLSDWSRRKTIRLSSVAANACITEAFEGGRLALMCVFVKPGSVGLSPSTVLHGFASHWQSLSAKDAALSACWAKTKKPLSRPVRSKIKASLSPPCCPHCLESNGKDKQ